MGGLGSGRSGGLPIIDQGLKIDLRSLRRRGQFRADGNHYQINLQWTYSYTEEKVGNVRMSYCAGGDGSWLRLEYTATPYGGEPFRVNETFALERFPQPFGGYRWYVICPRTHSRCQCLYLPPGATRFRSRQGFGVRLQYLSQNYDRRTRLMETGRKIAAKMLRGGPAKWREEYRDWDFPPKPPWMRWKTYNRQCARWEWYEQQSEADLTQWVMKLGG
ncbi:MAG: hypothetical protein ABIU05_27585 [Nitrospirales bacterium]